MLRHVDWDRLSKKARVYLVHAHDLNGVCRKNREGVQCDAERDPLTWEGDNA